MEAVAAAALSGIENPCDAEDMAEEMVAGECGDCSRAPGNRGRTPLVSNSLLSCQCDLLSSWS